METPGKIKSQTLIVRKGEMPAQPAVAKASDPFTVVIFGASGDLSKRKLIPALYNLHQDGCMPEKYAVIGFSRTPMSDQAYRDEQIAFMNKEGHGGKEGIQPGHPLVKALHYSAGNNDDPKSFQDLKAKIVALEKKLNLPANRLFYLSVAPKFFSIVIEQLKAAGLLHAKNSTHWSRVIIEKPFGRDLESARALNLAVTSVLDESQIYRIDHYLGKETVQNILSLRFGNAIFEPLFNNKFVDNVQLTVAEALGMEGKRGAYYDTAGSIRDMVQNHMFQLLCLTAMEPPAALDSQSIRDEKVKVLRALEPLTKEQVAATTIRAQFGAGEKDGQRVKSYLECEGVDPHSVTDTYVAMRLSINNWRWAGVPFYLRTGKLLAKRVTEIAIQFKRPPLHLFSRSKSSDFCMLEDRPLTNQLVIRIQPDEGISLTFGCKQPGLRIQLQEVDMDFFYKQAFDVRSPEAYERLILDALRGDASLFTRSDEVDYAWRFITSILDGWAQAPSQPVLTYAPYSDGPKEAARLMEGTSARWRALKDM